MVTANGDSDLGSLGGASQFILGQQHSVLFSQKASSLDRLPMDVVCLIFSHLSITELFELLPTLSKKWNAVAK